MAKDLIDWFWSELTSARGSRVPLYLPRSEGICQCSTENLIGHSINPDEMRAFLLIGVTIDQMMYTYYGSSCDHPTRLDRHTLTDDGDWKIIRWKNIYRKYLDSRFKFPSLYGHGGICGMASPSWLTYTSDRTRGVNWNIVDKVANILIGDLYEWFDSLEEVEEKRRFQKFLKLEIRQEFDSYSCRKLLPIFERLV